MSLPCCLAFCCRPALDSVAVAPSDRPPSGAPGLLHAGSLPPMQPIQGVGWGSVRRGQPPASHLLSDAESRRRDISLEKRPVEEVPDAAVGGNFFFSFRLLFTLYCLEDL